MKTLLIIILTLIIAPIVFLPLYLWVTYTDETYTSGEAYGFVIGESKIETYQKAYGNFINMNGFDTKVFIKVEVNENLSSLAGASQGKSILIQTKFDDFGLSNFIEKDRWKFYFDASFFNVVTLKFCNEKLCEIYRHRKEFELA